MQTYLYQYLSHDPALNIANQEYPQNNWSTNVSITNHLPVPVIVTIPYYLKSSGPAPAITPVLYHQAKIAPNGTFLTANLPNGGKAFARAWIVNLASTGGVIAVPDIPWSDDLCQVDITKAWLCTPGDFGPIPTPTASMPGDTIAPLPAFPVDGSTMIIPPDSPRVMVGCGKIDNGGTTVMVCREQYWQRQADSYCLAGKEKRTVNVTVTHGKQSTSSQFDTVSANVGMDASAGWGAFSASVSASLSTSSSTFQQVTVSEETTSYVSSELDNSDNDSPVMYLRWQMIDVLTLCDPTTHMPLSSVILAGSPVVVRGPYTLAT